MHERLINSDRHLWRRTNRNLNGHDRMEPKLNPQPDTNLCNPLDEYKPMPKMEPVNKLVYCDYVAAMIKEQLSKQTGMGFGKIISDLDPKEGFLISHKKVVELHYMGRDYKITVEEA